MEWKLNEIVNNGFCAACSICSVVCPNNLIDFDNKPFLKDECLRKGHGMCYEVCPRVSSGKYQIKIREGFKEEYYYGKGDIEGQDGGVVTTFLKYLIENKKIDGAIIVARDEYWKPISMIVQTADDIIKGAKSKYTISTMEALRKAGELGLKKVAVVGLPCQVNALRKIKYFPYLSKHDFELGRDGKPTKLPKIEYLIGLFCMEKFEYNNFKEVLEKHNINIKDVKKFDIKKGKLLVYLDNEVKEIKLSEFKVLDGCKVCRDFTAELADISVGSVGSPDGYSTIIIRTEKGEEIKKAIELKEGVDIEKIEKLKEKKLKRFKEEINRRKENNEFISYYWATDYGGVKKRGDGKFFIRVRAKPAGFYTIDEIEGILKVAKKYNAEIKTTDRGGFELHKVDGYYIDDIIKELKELNITTGSEGPLVRAVLACPGYLNCGNGLIETKKIAEIIEEKFKEYPSENKFKISISGCPSMCVRANIHDIGIVGVKIPKVNDKCVGCGRCYETCPVEAIYIRGETSYTNYNICVGCGKCIKNCPNEGREAKFEGFRIYIGGKSGRTVYEGFSYLIERDVDKVLKIIENTLKTYKKYTDKVQRERLAHVIRKVGVENFLKEVFDNI
ncbi:Coenzyme F420 hydrogenase/dehydrogenase, beta subunit C-terminal domain [Methanocaldococcus indicus]|uniref:Coenzyme F420 hydrogenase/dehydrogenase, beta subunit C-terminal domain n=1 Tax=Methanocaldococcus indicus TaxID=213231 RepID=UPI003C6CC81F